MRAYAKTNPDAIIRVNDGEAPEGYTFDEPPSAQDGHTRQHIDGAWHQVPDPDEPEPLSPEEELAQWRESARVSRRQAKQSLLLASLLAGVQPAIDAIVDDTERAMVQIYWDDATEFERSNAQLIGLGYALGLTDEQIDQLFVDAAKL